MHGGVARGRRKNTTGRRRGKKKSGSARVVLWMRERARERDHKECFLRNGGSLGSEEIGIFWNISVLWQQRTCEKGEREVEGSYGWRRTAGSGGKVIGCCFRLVMFPLSKGRLKLCGYIFFSISQGIFFVISPI